MTAGGATEVLGVLAGVLTTARVVWIAVALGTAVEVRHSAPLWAGALVAAAGALLLVMLTG